MQKIIFKFQLIIVWTITDVFNLNWSVLETYSDICVERKALFTDFRCRARKQPSRERNTILAKTTDTNMIKSTAISFIIIYVMEALLIIIGNSFTIFVFWKQKLHQKRTFFVLTNLTVADLLVGIAEPIVLSTGKFYKMTTVTAKQNRETNPSSALQLLASSSSVYFLALIALERAYAVLWPLRHRVINTRVYIYGIVIVWVTGLCSAGLSLLSMHYTKVDKTFFTVSIHIFLFIALLVICASYIKIRNRLRSSPTEIAPQTNRYTEHNSRLSRTMFITIAASLVFWLPAFVVYTVREFCPRCFSPFVNWLVNALHLANSMVNPFVYTFRMPIFKNALKKFWRKRRQNLEVQPVQADGVRFNLGGAITPQMERTKNASNALPTTEILT